jgi:PBSX family phage terminase large subunit
MSLIYKPTSKQLEAVKILANPNNKHIMLSGGSRSGKTFQLIKAMIIRASKTRSRHAILRSVFNHAKTAIWLDTLPKVVELCFPHLKPKLIKSDYYLQLANESEIWVGGLDDAKRVEKILGKEYSTIFFNECSQIEYPAVRVALTRLAEKNDLKKKVYYDQNPPNKRHWTYWVFEKKINPEENVPLNSPESYASFRMNPFDNIENIDSDYIQMLKELPERDRLRFLEGEYTEDGMGCAYYAFNREKNVSEVTKQFGSIFIGMDFNVNPMSAIIAQIINQDIHVIDEAFLPNSDTYKMCHYLKTKNYMGSVIPDSTGRNRKTSGQTDFQILKENGFQVIDTHNPYIVDRVNNLNRLLHQGRIKINPKCVKLIADLERVQWDKTGSDLDEGKDRQLTHISDALGYLAYRILPMIQQQPTTIKPFA